MEDNSSDILALQSWRGEEAVEGMGGGGCGAVMIRGQLRTSSTSWVGSPDWILPPPLLRDNHLSKSKPALIQLQVRGHQSIEKRAQFRKFLLLACQVELQPPPA